ncbi:XdhC family protein [Nocardioides sp. BYT-33-1]|uniref:XdhC family protein n=1 Tax=Nocardioides sp. BYT-33-1 TaxID=3416952 RepID=UPI003F53383D
MYEHLEALRRAMAAGTPIGIASVVSAYRSSPRPVGASMLVDCDGRVHGSVSGGCVEAAVFDSLQGVLHGEPSRVDRYGISDDDAFAVGLTCGGVIEVLVDVLLPTDRSVVEEISLAVSSEQPVAMLTLLGAPSSSDQEPATRRAVITPDDVRAPAPWLTPSVLDRARDLLARGSGGLVDLDRSGVGIAGRVFVDCWRPRPRMIIFGSTQIAAELARQGKGLGYRVTVCDARSTFATPDRFPDADEVVVDWPHRYLRAESEAERTGADTVVCVLTHDAKFEVPLLSYLLVECPNPTKPGFVGVMGSRRTHDDRQHRLVAAGVSLERQSDMASPFGLDLGGATPAETALSMAAEIVAWRYSGSGRRLSTTSGDIHRAPVRPAAVHS